MPRCRTPPTSPRSCKGTPGIAPYGFIVAHPVPPRAAHPVPKLERLGVQSEPSNADTSDGNSLHCRLGASGELSSPTGRPSLPSSVSHDVNIPSVNSLVPLLLANFGKLYSQNAQILAHLKAFEEKYGQSIAQELRRVRMSTRKGTLGSLRSVQMSVGETVSAGRSLTGGSVISSTLRSGTQESLCPEFADRPTKGSSSDCSVAEKGFNERASAETHVSFTSNDRMRITNLKSMEKLAQIIQSHSKFAHGSITQSLWLFLEDRKSSRWAYFYGSYFAPFFLVLSVAISFFQTTDEFAMPDKVFDAVQSIFEVWFAVEIAIRFLVCPDKWYFWFDLFNAIDFLSVVPLFLRIYVWIADYQKQDVLQVIALVPMMRLLKVLRRFHKFQLLLSAFSIALEALPVLIFSLMLIAIMFSGLMYLVETREKLATLPDSLWFVMVTMTTVGYGDITPDGMLGRALSVVLMILSALYMALPIGIVGNAFSEVWKDRDRLLLLAVLRESFAISGVSRALIREIFAQFGSKEDTDGSDCEPEMSFADFKNLIRALQLDFAEDRLLLLFDVMDVDGGGTISCDEFLMKLFPSRFYDMRAPTMFLKQDSFAWRSGAPSTFIGSHSPQKIEENSLEEEAEEQDGDSVLQLSIEQ